MELFNIKLVDFQDLGELFFRFLFNIGVVFIIIRYIYYPIRRRRDYLLTYALISTIIFLLCFLLDNVKLEIGFALGLFAIFGIIRYRTRQIPIKEMTYLFLVIGISVINALSNKKVSYAELIVTNLLVITVAFLLERVLLLRHESSKIINYEKIELIKPENRDKLKADLEARTGLEINRIQVGKIDFLKDSAKVMIYYYDSSNSENLADDEITSGGDDD
ncbi:MAG: DUF4956 domain-containing protein [Bacteroidales bacterium]|jgi:hypothetical protein|nr:DUF4956 domain-containing protein [Bacteroidales bacterium]